MVYNSVTVPPLAAFAHSAGSSDCIINSITSFHPHACSIFSLYLDVSLSVPPTFTYLFNLFYLCFVYPPVCSSLSLLLSHLVFFSISLPPTFISFCSIYSTQQRVSLTLCPCVLTWSMEIDSLKYLLWNLLCDDNSRPFPCKTGKAVNPNLRKNKPLWLFLQPLKCKLLSLMGSPTRGIRRNIYEHVTLVQMGCS